LGPRRELLQARERVAPRAVLGGARRRVARGEAAVRLGVPLRNGGVHVGRRAAGADEPVPLLAYDAGLTARCGAVLERWGRGRLGGVLRVALGGDALVHLAKDRACALGRALVLRARGDLLQLAAIGDPFDGRERRIAEVAVERRAENLGVILEGLEGARAHR